LASLAFVLGSARSVASESIDYEPVSLDQARELIEVGDVTQIVIRPDPASDTDFWYFLRSDGPDADRRWRLQGVDVHVFTNDMPNGTTILASDGHSVGLTPPQLEDLSETVDQYNARASSPIDMRDERG
jgi:hypothetical protein